MSTAYLLAGLPGSGKSEAADILETITGGQKLVAGEMIREMYKDDTGKGDPDSHELARFASAKRDELGPGFFGEEVIRMLDEDEYFPEMPLVVDSVRHVDGMANFRSYFDSAPLIFVQASFETRLDRLQDRGRDDEADFTREDLNERDRIEITELGQATLSAPHVIDYEVENEGTLHELESELRSIVNDGE